jgi:hypothetical protein
LASRQHLRADTSAVVISIWWPAMQRAVALLAAMFALDILVFDGRYSAVAAQISGGLLRHLGLL